MSAAKEVYRRKFWAEEERTAKLAAERQQLVEESARTQQHGTQEEVPRRKFL